MSDKDGGQAFPAHEKSKEFDDDIGDYVDCSRRVGGMTLRQWYKGKVLSDIISNKDAFLAASSIAKETGKEVEEVVAIYCASYADAMIKEDKEHNES